MRSQQSAKLSKALVSAFRVSNHKLVWYFLKQTTPEILVIHSDESLYL